MDDFFGELEEEKMEKEEKKNAENATMPPRNGSKQGKIKRIILSVCLAIISFFVGGFAVWFSLDGEIRTLIKIKSAIQKEYYFEVTDEDFYGKIFEAVNEGLLDDYSYYMTADEFLSSQASMAGAREGIGVSFSVQNDKGEPQMKIVRVAGNSPAEAAGLRAGDELTGFGVTPTDMTSSVEFNVFSTFLSGLTLNTDFYVRVKRAGVEETFVLQKKDYVESYVFYRTKTTAYGFSGEKADVFTEKGEPLSCLDEETAYVRLVRFGGIAAENFKTVLKQFKKDGKKNLVLDLRENGGGYLDTMQTLAGYFCKTATGSRPIVAIADYGERQEKFCADFNAYDEYFSTDSRICVLADVGTASASECLIGAMVDYGAVSYSDICLSERNGVAKTFGKGIMQTTFYLGVKKDAIKLTTAQIRWPSGYGIHGRGILPEDGAKTVTQGENDDMEIAAAIATLFS